MTATPVLLSGTPALRCPGARPKLDTLERRGICRDLAHAARPCLRAAQSHGNSNDIGVRSFILSARHDAQGCIERDDGRHETRRTRLRFIGKPGRMKPVAFDYARPLSVREACTLLAGDENARVLAGGQTLIPMLAMRLARPSCLVDIARIAELSGIRDERDPCRDRRHDPAGGRRARPARGAQGPAARQGPALGRACADPQPRYGRRLARQRRSRGGNPAGGRDARGNAGRSDRHGGQRTVCGRVLSRAHDHGAAGGRQSSRRCASPYGARPRIGTGFHEVSARKSDFALVSAAAQVALDARRPLHRARPRHRRSRRHPGAARTPLPKR